MNYKNQLTVIFILDISLPHFRRHVIFLPWDCGTSPCPQRGAVISVMLKVALVRLLCATTDLHESIDKLKGVSVRRHASYINIAKLCESV